MRDDVSRELYNKKDFMIRFSCMKLFKFLSFIKERRETIEDFEEYLLLSGFGISFSEEIIKVYKKKGKRGVREFLLDSLRGARKDLSRKDFSVYLFSGVNGSGKTTCIAKIGNTFKKEGEKVLFISADTFRAGATEQMEIWGDRFNIEVFSGKKGADPASVVYDGIVYAKNRNFTKVLVDTAGRLENKKNLMKELEKIRRVIEKLSGIQESILVLDSTDGENLYSQVESFRDASKTTALFITKIDSTIKPGIVIPLYRTYKIPIAYLFTGEGVEDIVPFDPEEFVNLILDPYFSS